MVATQADVPLKQTSQLGLTKDIAIGAGGFGFNLWAGTGR